MSEILLPFGLDPVSGRMINVNEAIRGANCNCICPSCKAPLVARKGEKLAWHFAHFSSGGGCTSSEAYESMLHKLAKQVICDASAIRAPGLHAHHLGKWVQILAPTQLGYTCPRQELWIKGIRPDVLVLTEHWDIAIEIHVSHKVDEDKKKKIKELGIATFEIDLTDKEWRTAPIERISGLVLQHAAREWIFHPNETEIRAKYLAELENEERILAEAAQMRAAEESRKRSIAEAEAAARLREYVAGLLRQEQLEEATQLARLKAQQAEALRISSEGRKPILGTCETIRKAMAKDSMRLIRAGMSLDEISTNLQAINSQRLGNQLPIEIIKNIILLTAEALKAYPHARS